MSTLKIQDIKSISLNEPPPHDDILCVCLDCARWANNVSNLLNPLPNKKRNVYNNYIKK